MAKKFFYVCAGIFLLALAYQLGATTASAQLGGDPIVGHIDQYHQGGFAVAINRVVYYGNADTGSLGHSAPVPGTSPIVAVEGYENVLLANGDVYTGGGGRWRFAGNVVGSAVATESSTWGQVKVGAR